MDASAAWANFPAGHGVHESTFVPENFPAGQSLQAPAFLPEYFPPGHSPHDPLGGLLLYWPAAQSEHDVALASEY